jgi:hypothetical protein
LREKRLEARAQAEKAGDAEAKIERDTAAVAVYKKIAEDREKEMVARKAAAKPAAPAKVREARAQSAFERIHDNKS